MSVVATAYLLGVSTRRVERLAAELGVTQLSKSQVSAMAKHLDEQVAAFRNRPLDAGPYPVLWIDALTRKVRENGRVLTVHALVAVGVNGDGQREILGIDVALGRGRHRLAGVPALVDRPRPVRGTAGDLRCAPGPGRGDRRRHPRRGLAVLPHPLES